MESLKIFFMSLSLTLACDRRFPENFYNGCSFNSLILVNPSTGFVIADENCGLEIDKETFYEQPFVFFTDALVDKKYTLIMVDHDNPLTFNANFYLHWLVTDIDGDSLRHGFGVDQGNVLAGEFFPVDRLILNLTSL